MSKSYLAWPVKLKDLSQELHVTLKYLGDSPFTLGDLGRRLAGIDTKLDLTRALWVPERFDHGAHVMVLDGLSSAPHAAHAAVKDLRKDDYPTWRPHMTLPALPWARLTAAKATAKDTIESVGPLTLYVDKKAVVTF